MYYTISTFSPSTRFLLFFLFFILFVYNLLGSVRQLLHSIVLSLSLSFHFYLASQFRAFEIIKARIFQRAVPAKLVFCFDVAIDRTWPRALDNAFCPRRYTQRFNETFYRLTNVLDFFFSFSHFLKPVKGSLSLSLARSRAIQISFFCFSTGGIYIAFTDVMRSTVGFRGCVRYENKNTEEFLPFRASHKQMRLD